jgi:hypothetical protein
MSPPPKPLAASAETLAWETANDPRVAWMPATVGAGPRSKGFVAAAWAEGTRVTPPTAIVTAAAAPTRLRARSRRRGRRSIWI